MKRPEESMRRKLAALARNYTPEWRFSPEDPDVGTDLALLLEEMLAGSRARLGQALHKHKVEYMNLFDRLRGEPVESAKSFVEFTPVPGAPGPVHVPKGVRLFAQGDGGGRITFETTHGMTASAAALAAVFSTRGGEDRITPLYLRSADGDAVRFTAFDEQGENLSEHTLLLAFDDAFDDMDDLDMALRVRTALPEQAKEAAGQLARMRFELLGADGSRTLSAQAQEDAVRLKLTGARPQKLPLGGRMRYGIAVSPQGPTELEISSLELCVERGDLRAAQVLCGGVSQDPRHFLPFGRPMEILSECEMECPAAFAKRGTRVRMEFSLSFETLEQKLPEVEEEVDYHVVMKRRSRAPQAAVQDIRADYVLLEYYGARGWKRLLHDEHAALLFNGSASGEVALEFDAPPDWQEAEHSPVECRLRLRLLRADNLYRIPSRQFCPVMDNLRFSYRYSGSPRTPDYAATRNNFETARIGEALRLQRPVRLFYSREEERPCMYLGFDAPPAGMPLSLYWDVENRADFPIDLTMEYLGPDGFTLVKTVDNTGGLLYPGTMLLLVADDAVKRELFGRSLYWLRMINHNPENPRYQLPLVRDIRLNMARVENRRTRSETFYVENEGAAFHIDLDGSGLIAARVFVREEGGRWEEWKRRAHISERGRVCDIDLPAGTVDFARGAFSSFPLDEAQPAVRVEYQSYHGSAANVPAGAIRTFGESIRYIASAQNPIPAYGGYDGYNEETSAAMLASLLRTRSRAVCRRDYFDIISQASYSVRSIRCRCGVDRQGREAPDTVTIVLLIDEFDKGGHIFSAVKDTVRARLLACSDLLPQGRRLVLIQPYFVQMSVRIWLECESMEGTYDLQQGALESIRSFLDPLCGGFEGRGWEIGTLPTVRQLTAYLKTRHPELTVSRMVMTASFGDREYPVDEAIYRHIRNPFAMAVNGRHTVYVDLPAR